MAGGNMANMANMANAGLAGGANAGSGGGWFFADRVDLPFVTLPSPGDNSKTIGQNPIKVSGFGKADWAADWYAWLVISEFAASGFWDPQKLPGYDAKLLPAGVTMQAGDAAPDWSAEPFWSTGAGAAGANSPTVVGEIANLVTAAQNERPDALAEILAQADEFASYFMNLLTARPTSAPATAKMLTIMNLVGEFAAMQFKWRYQRPRASQVCPALLPPLMVPGHASLPSGHSTQAHLMAYAIRQIVSNDPARKDVVPDDALALAGRIARNREIAGLHYQSDTRAGIALAGLVWDALVSDSCPRFAAALTAAEGEWPRK